MVINGEVAEAVKPGTEASHTHIKTHPFISHSIHWVSRLFLTAEVSLNT